jgi:hypothetical protein
MTGGLARRLIEEHGRPAAVGAKPPRPWNVVWPAHICT